MIKGLTGKFMPIKQLVYFDVVEVLEQDLMNPEPLLKEIENK